MYVYVQWLLVNVPHPGVEQRWPLYSTCRLGTFCSLAYDRFFLSILSTINDDDDDAIIIEPWTIMLLWRGGNKAPLRYRQRRHEAKCRWNICGFILVALTVAISISLSSFWTFWATTRSDGSSFSTSEFVSPRRNYFLTGRDGDIPSTNTRIDDNCIPPRRSRGLEHIQVVKPSSYSHKEMKILCFLMTDSSHHPTKVKAVWDTWGTKCDKIVIASNMTDPSIGAVQMKSDSSYSNLWHKLEETLHYICDQYLDEYDWFVKVDDDSYIIMENLRQFLSNVNDDDDHEKPLIYGRRYSYPPLVDLPNEPQFFPDLPENQAFRERFIRRVHGTHSESQNLIYTQGGAQVMNRKYLEELVKVLDSPDKVVGTPPEGMYKQIHNVLVGYKAVAIFVAQKTSSIFLFLDMALGMVMWYRGIAPQPSRDSQGRELFHPEIPPHMYDLPSSVAYLHDYHSQVGGVSAGSACCSLYSISFHHVSEKQMRHYHRQLYHCFSDE
jgi:glycoprotein-N-acetylgalactosamine 3-beta-galactosyltransferase